MGDDLFHQCLTVVLEFEGGFVDDPDDRGGATNYGITQATFNRWNVLHSVPERHVGSITMKEVEDIYRVQYWNGGHCHFLPPAIACFHFDACVLHGINRAARFLQMSVKAFVDGIIGHETISKVVSADDHLTISFYAKNRENFFRMLVEENKSQGKFLNGWLNRIEQLKSKCWEV